MPYCEPLECGNRLLLRLVAAAERIARDLVVLDVLMPGLSGIDVCDELRSSARTSIIPILFCTGSPHLLPPRVTTAKQAAVEVLAKPFEGAFLRKAVRRLLSGQAALTS